MEVKPTSMVDASCYITFLAQIHSSLVILESWVLHLHNKCYRQCIAVVLNQWYSCHLWHFDQKIVKLWPKNCALCLYFYVTLLTQRCLEYDTQANPTLNIHAKPYHLYITYSRTCTVVHNVHYYSWKMWEPFLEWLEILQNL